MRNEDVRRLLVPNRCDFRPDRFAGLKGTAENVILEMKRRAGCETDVALAAFLHKARSAVAQWRRRGSVPEGAILRLLTLLDEQQAA